jgi:hypothetical protein
MNTPLKLYWNPVRGDNCTIATVQAEQDQLRSGYQFVRNEGYVYPNPEPNTVPLKLFWHPGRGDNCIVATAQGEQDQLRSGYQFVRNEGYVYPNPEPNTVPLKLFWHSGRGDNCIVATAQGEQDQLRSGYQFVRIEGYVAPNLVNTNIPVLINGVTPLDIKATADPLLPALQAIAQGKWRMWKVSVPDLGLGFDAVPVGVEVHLSKQAFDSIRSAVSWDTVKSLADLLGKVMEAGDIEKAAALVLAGFSPSAATAITKTAAVLGITMGQALALVLVLLIIITYQLTAIVTQVKGRELLGETFPNGLCLQHPLIAFGAIAVVTAPTTFGSFLAAQLAVNTPVIVAPH